MSLWSCKKQRLHLAQILCLSVLTPRRLLHVVTPQMSDAEDDYLSDKFLAQAPAPSSSKQLTYAERRRQAKREADIKNEQNRRKSRRELEEDSRREGLSKSLFEKAKEEEQSGVGQGSKAMAMMMKVGPRNSHNRHELTRVPTSVDGVQAWTVAGQGGRASSQS